MGATSATHPAALPPPRRTKPAGLICGGGRQLKSPLCSPAHPPRVCGRRTTRAGPMKARPGLWGKVVFQGEQGGGEGQLRAPPGKKRCCLDQMTSPQLLLGQGRPPLPATRGWSCLYSGTCHPRHAAPSLTALLGVLETLSPPPSSPCSFFPSACLLLFQSRKREEQKVAHAQARGAALGFKMARHIPSFQPSTINVR